MMDRQSLAEPRAPVEQETLKPHPVEGSEVRPGADQLQKGLVPLVIGVVGHRDPHKDDVEKLTEHLESFFEALAARYPDTPLVILSPLAEGADRLVARAALAVLAERCTLIAPLPMDEKEYEKDFPDTRQAFSELVARARHVFAVPLARTVDPTQTQDRNDCYEAAGHYVTRNSFILLAIWDGLDNGLQGGTAATVNHALRGDPHTPPLEEPEITPVVHFVVRRTPKAGSILAKPPASGLVAGTIRVRLTGDDTASADSATWQDCPDIQSFVQQGGLDPHGIAQEFNDYNQRAGQCTAADRIAQSASWLFPDKAIQGLQVDNPSLAQSLAQLRCAYARADCLATQDNSSYRAFLKRIILLSVAAIALFESYDNLWTTLPMLLGYILVSGAAYGLYRREKNRLYQRHYLDERALAEGLRVQFHWSLAGVARHDSRLPAHVSDHYLTTHKSNLAWIRKAIAAIVATLHPQTLVHADPQQHQRGIELVCTYWVDDQFSYFRKTLHKQDALRQRFARISSWALRVSFFFGALLLLTECLHSYFEGLWTQSELILGVTFGALLAGVLETYADQLMPKRQMAQNTRLYQIFGKAKALLQKALGHQAEDPACPPRLEVIEESNGAAARILYDLGKEALQENASWVEIHRERPIEMMHG